ncbi:MAG: hypothetical protein RIQ89_551 [Bacteroidota bacterium]
MLLSELRPNQLATIQSIDNSELTLQLMEMGCLPGEQVELYHIAPLGDPIAITISGYVLCLRKSEAAAIRIVLNND